MVRNLLALIALAGLSACNVLVTDKPLFTAADETGAPALKPGVWLIFDGPGCDVDVNKPIDEWPDCAGGGVVHPGEIIDHDQKAAKGVWEHSPFVFAAGDPRIAQVQVKMNTATNTGAKTTLAYGYGGALATKFDGQGRIVALSYWPAFCGPPPPKNKDGSVSSLGGTAHPFPGLVMAQDHLTCSANSPAAVRAAAKASEAYKDAPDEARWLRDGDR